MVALMVGVGWQQLRSRPVVSASTTTAAIALQASVKNRSNENRSTENHAIETSGVPALQSPMPSSPAMLPILNQQSSGPEISVAPQVASASPISASTLSQDVIAKPVVAPSSASTSFHVTKTTAHQASAKRGNNLVAANASHTITSVASLQDSSSTSMPLRLQISGPPRKLVYPLSPDDSTRGKVSLQAVVGFDGKVNQVKVLAGNRLLATAAARAIREWRYQPFSENGQQVERETRITVSFISTDVVAVSFPDAAQASR
jgi:outer membrane biosynthesis protein TonB